MRRNYTIFSKQFARIFNSYAQAFNKMYNRHGALIESPFKSKDIESDEYLIRTILYIHQNPQNHGIINDFKNYKFSSYSFILNDETTFLKRDEVLELFSGKDNFVFTHQNEVEHDHFDY